MSTRFGSFCALAVLTWVLGTPAGAGGIGVLGDSYSDEYQFYHPHRDSARNWVEILARTRGVDFGEFRTSSWGEPRNQGFAYNWARSGATSADMIAQRQHLGLAAQVSRGDVSIAVIFVGGNDFIEALHAPDPASVMGGLGRRAAANVKLAADALLGASPDLRLLIATVPDVRDLPEFRDSLHRGELDAQLAVQATSEIDAFNAEIRRLVTPGGRVAIFEFARISRVSRVLQPTHVLVAGRKVDRERPGDAPDHLFLGDVRHLGTMGQGMLARFLVDSLNKKCGATIKPLEEREIVILADTLAPANIAATAPTAPARAEATGRRGD